MTVQEAKEEAVKLGTYIRVNKITAPGKEWERLNYLRGVVLRENLKLKQKQ